MNPNNVEDTQAIVRSGGDRKKTPMLDQPSPSGEYRDPSFSLRLEYREHEATESGVRIRIVLPLMPNFN